MIIIITSLICLAVHIVFTWDGMILQPLGDRISGALPEWLTAPMYQCLPCMGVYYSLGAWLLSMNPQIAEHPFLHNLIHIPNADLGIMPSMLCTVGLNGILLMGITMVRTAQHRLELLELSLVQELEQEQEQELEQEQEQEQEQREMEQELELLDMEALMEREELLELRKLELLEDESEMRAHE